MADVVVEWLPDGTPRSPRFDDIYRSRGADGQGGLAQARHVFLGGCGLLPDDGQSPAWAGAARWHVLENGFGLGLNFLATWQAWRADASAPSTLCYTATEAHPATADDLRRSAAPFAHLQPLAAALAERWMGLLPGVHRWTWEWPADGGDGPSRRLLLTLCVGEAARWLPTLDVPVNSVFLDGFDPAANPDMWSPDVLRAVARLCQPGTRLGTWTVARAVRDGLAQAGFRVEKAPGLPPKRHCLRAVFAPSWTPRAALRSASAPAAAPGSPPPQSHAVVIGAGLAGSAAAWSLAARGWRVTVLDAADAPATGASGLPVGLVAPHVSPDDAPLSRLTRAGLASTLERARALLTPGVDWSPSGVFEHRVEGKRALPDTGAWREHGQVWSEPADPARTVRAGLPADTPALWHPQAAWLRPARLVAAQLARAGVRFVGGARVAGLRRTTDDAEWIVIDDTGRPVAQAPVVVVCAGFGSLALLPHTDRMPLPLHALRGQVTWGPMAALSPSAASALPPFPVNGHGSLIAGVPGPDGQPLWCMGSTFIRGSTDRAVQAADHAANLDKLRRLLPPAAEALSRLWPQAHGWAGVRCTLPDRFPAVGAVEPDRLPGLCVLTGLGARGLTLSVLCGEVLAAELHGEPWPVERPLAQALLARRFAAPRGRSSAGGGLIQSP
ncbi:tRNA 5-methylaminomethyl-2-thiouridine biosynthesis bifunctional protein MnmC [Tepidimonas fonticaldi]|uniref:tRNA 5-methylaminomethyl-2-thiouridine biosynthesis bifunctional protein MnmC n=1 Tax=Tepidimonas fonticaldi TaxID=1101373 RepID=A0A554XFZ7_9BURK|nr:FAD-dependent 5-carboxymethylaminomethyl-2-thiouridine(34) oxidoreductase MnmC [Tepidimonas fonticaldi]TSE34766.1 tRNA 5-methylaminomethyl-2-thiouridine biosynthesis bifunctional protein MnmC [Tepidimonas fonticaldi]